jgi:uroporphyrinogen decarboxylase
VNSKERVMRAIYFEEPDRIPFQISLHRILRPKVQEAWPGKSLPQLSDIVVGGASTPRGWRPRKLDDNNWIDEWGVLRSPRVAGSIDWFETCPLSSPEGLESYEFPDPYASGRLDDLDEKIAEYGETHCIFGAIGWLLWERAWILRGMHQLIVDMYQRPEFVGMLLDRVMEYDIALAKQIVERRIDVFQVGDDYGCSQGPLLSPSLWRRFIKPRIRRIFEIPLAKGIPVALHSDGDVRPLVKDLIEVGVRVLNPVSPLEMEAEALRSEVGDRLCFWGTADIHRTLPFGTPEQVANEVRDRLSALGPSGGLIYGARLQTPETPPENVVTLVKVLKRYGQYPRR